MTDNTQPILPNNEQALWDLLFSLSSEFFGLKPWDLLYETDIFAVRSPDTGRDYFISIMGSLGEAYALAAYQGEAALEQFWHIQEADGKLPPGTILTIPHLMVSLEEFDNIDNNQIKYMELSGVKPGYKGLFTKFGQIIPGLLPVVPDKEILSDLVHILRQSIWVIRHIPKNGKVFLHTEGDSEEDYYFRLPVLNKGKTNWKGQKKKVDRVVEPIEATYNSEDLKQFKKLAPYRDILQMELTPLPYPMREPGKPDYFPVSFMMVNARTGVIVMYETLTPFPSYAAMLAKLPDIIMQKSLEMGCRPSRVKFRTLLLGLITAFLQKHTDAKIWHSYQLPAVDEALESLVDSLDKNRGHGPV